MITVLTFFLICSGAAQDAAAQQEGKGEPVRADSTLVDTEPGFVPVWATSALGSAIGGAAGVALTNAVSQNAFQEVYGMWLAGPALATVGSALAVPLIHRSLDGKFAELLGVSALGIPVGLAIAGGVDQLVSDQDEGGFIILFSIGQGFTTAIGVEEMLH